MQLKRFMQINHLFPNIIHLDLEWGEGFDVRVLIKISQAYSNLSYLNVYNNGELTDYSIIEIIKKYKKLQFLDIGYAGLIILRNCTGMHAMG